MHTHQAAALEYNWQPLRTALHLQVRQHFILARVVGRELHSDLGLTVWLYQALRLRDMEVGVLQEEKRLARATGFSLEGPDLGSTFRVQVRK